MTKRSWLAVVVAAVGFWTAARIFRRKPVVVDGPVERLRQAGW